jgi:hypothetical protein
MIIVLLTWLSHYFILKTAGNISLRVFASGNRSWFDELLTGYCSLTVFAVILSLFIPVNAWVHLALLIFSVCYLTFNRLVFPALRPNYGQIIIAGVLLVMAVPVPHHGDSAFYHAQALKWIEHYKVVPGLGNFFGRLAFDSTLFTTQSVFSFYPFSDISSRFLNSFLILIWFVHLFTIASDPEEPSGRRLMAVLFACITMCITRGWVSTIATDVAVGLFMLIISYKVTDGLVFNSHSSPTYLLLLCFTAISIKLPAALLLPVVVLYLAIHRQFKWTSIVIPTLVMLPWIVRNLLLSGYIVYPYLPMVIWQPEWTVPAGLTVIERNWITSWARMPGKPWEDVISLSFRQWFPPWFVSQSTLNRALLIVLAFTLSGLIIHSTRQMITKRSIAIIPRMLLLWGGSIVVWFISAPDFRFGYGLIMPFLVLIFFYLFERFIPLNEALLVMARTGFLGVLVLFMLYFIIKEKAPLQNLVLDPQPYPERPMKKVKTTFGLINIAPGKESCWDSPLPCINDDLLPDNIELRGTTIQEGFRPMAHHK